MAVEKSQLLARGSDFGLLYIRRLYVLVRPCDQRRLGTARNARRVSEKQ